MKKKLTWKGLGEVFRHSFCAFSEYKLTRLSGSLAYYTVFSMGPLLIVIIFLGSIFYGKEAAEGRVYFQLQELLGKGAALDLQQVIANASLSGERSFAAILGFVTLIIGATTVFAEIQDSINTIWGVKPKPRRGWLKYLKNRLLSFSIIVSLGFLLVVSLIFTSLIDAFSNRLQQAYPDITVVVFYIINQVITLLIISFVFAVVFKVLPDARIRWSDVIAGALFTTLLFIIGKLGISLYIRNTEVASAYGAAGSLVILLVWTYYSSLILFYGAAFTKAYAITFGRAIYPNENAVSTKQIELELEKKPLEIHGKQNGN